MSNILDKIDSPADLKKLSGDELTQLAAEIRERMISVVSANGGHLASSLGVVELTIALHRVFDSPRDKIIWDVGHQSYAHKLLTGRREQFSSIRQHGGLSGFPVRTESPHDAFSTGHAGTSVSAALGMALARDLNKEKYHVVAVIGDGSLGAGMAFEAINHAGHLGTRLIIVLNDNGMAISPSVGALARLMNRVKLDSRYAYAKKRVEGAFARLPYGEYALTLSKRMKTGMESVIVPKALWEELGFAYLGPLDGHNIREMETALIRARDSDARPVLIHVLTKKGKGYPAAETDVVKYHGISPNGGVKNIAPSYSQVLGQTLSRLMKDNKRIVAISAAMIDGTGLAGVAAEFPDRVYDVGICEQHAVTLAAGLATQGFVPVVAIYSTFLQRAYDQIIHDVCMQHLPVVFAIDRAGIVGEDGKTHQGTFDISYLRCVPDMIIASPADEDELQHLIYTAIRCQQPFAVRFPRGNGQGVRLTPELHELAKGKGEIVRDGKDLTIVALGPPVYSALAAAETMVKEGVDCAVINARFAKPLDAGLIVRQAEKTGHIITVEENTYYGGFGSAVTDLLCNAGVSGVKVECLGLPDSFIEHSSQELLRSLFNIDSKGIAQRIRTSCAGHISEVLTRVPKSV